MRRLLVLVVLVATAGCAVAQSADRLPPGQPSAVLPLTSTLAGELTPEAPRLADSSFVHQYALESTGASFEVSLLSSEFDTYLTLISPSGSTYSNDDYGSDTGESRVLIPRGLAEAGMWTAQANTLSPGETGAYALAHQYVLELQEDGLASLPSGASLSGSITPESLLLPDSTRFYEIPFVSDGTPFEVRLSSYEFDPVLVLISPSDTLYENDDYGSVRESRLVILPKESEVGEWRVRVKTYGVGATGEYILSQRPLAASDIAEIERAEEEQEQERIDQQTLTEVVVMAEHAERLYGEGRKDEARETIVEALTAAYDVLGPDEEFFSLINLVASLAYRNGDLETAAELYEESLSLEQPLVLGMSPPLLSEEEVDPEEVDPEEVDPEEAELEEVIVVAGAMAPDAGRAITLYNLALIRADEGDLDEALRLYERVLQIEEALYGPDDPEVAVTLATIGDLRQRRDEPAEARALYRRALDILEAASGGDTSDGVTELLIRLARLDAQAGSYREARAHYDRALAAQEAQLGGDAPETAELVNAVGEIVQLQAFADALPFYERALEAQAAALGDDDEATVRTRNNLERLLEAQKDLLAGAPPTRSRGPRGREAPSPLVRQGLDRAVLFATNDYTDTTGTWGDLTNPILDAEAIATELADRYGFDTLVVRNPTRTQILDVLRDERRAQVPENGQLFVFFAGHGTVDGDQPRDPGFLIPADGGDRPSANWVNYDNLSAELGRMPYQRVLAVFDACRGGSFFKERRSQTATDIPLPPSQIVTEYSKYKARLAVTSGARQQDVSDGEPGDYSPFAFQLLSALRSGGGPNADGLLLYNEILGYTTPIDGQSPLAGDFGSGHQPGGTFFFLDTERAQAFEARTGGTP